MNHATYTQRRLSRACDKCHAHEWKHAWSIDYSLCVCHPPVRALACPTMSKVSTYTINPWALLRFWRGYWRTMLNLYGCYIFDKLLFQLTSPWNNKTGAEFYGIYLIAPSKLGHYHAWCVVCSRDVNMSGGHGGLENGCAYITTLTSCMAVLADLTIYCTWSHELSQVDTRRACCTTS